MSGEFFVQQAPPDAAYERLSALNGANPFLTKSYAEAQRSLGFEPIIFGLKKSGDEWTTASSGFLRRSRLRRSLTIPSIPPVPADSAFWPELFRTCRDWRVTELELESFACFSTHIPQIPGESGRTTRCEFYLDLQASDLPSRLSKNHRQSIKRARSAGVQIQRSRNAEALDAHMTLMTAALDRHRKRGEHVTGGDGARLLPLLETGSGELFQAVKDGTVLSSALVIMSPRGAYYHSAGTGQEGLACGASQFLVHSISLALQEQGLDYFFLGGTDQPASGVALFKSCFGASRIDLESATAYLGSRLHRKLTSFVKGTRHGRRWIQFDRFFVYSIEPSCITSAPRSDLRLEKLSDEQIRTLPQEFSANVERIERYGFNDAYGLFDGDQIVHVSWLITADHNRARDIQVLDLRPGEAELAHSHTSAAYRGRGIYPSAIAAFSRVAVDSGIHRLYAVVAPSNSSSIRAIEKTGPWRKGHLARVVRRFGRGGQLVLFRGHRWTR